ncbi:arylsulfatase [Prosthecobacter sp.]|jgi:arylsulfatase A|uniref:arylsulfatase n=1 Tax=Prosthecobacter sp. TaxID=1965333 RepID=UPI003783C297
MKHLLLLLIALCTVLHAAERPNVVVILSDDYGWGSVGCYGANPELVSTPNLDRLAKEGRRFTDANTTSSVCSPTRYSMMTGRYCWRTSLISEVLSTVAPLHIETTRLTMASMLKSQGYNCAAVGKWHLGYGTAERCDYTKELKPGPLEIGFDYHFGVPSNHGDMAGVYVENHWVLGLNKESPSQPSPPYVTMGQQKGKPTKTLDLNAPKRVDENVMETLTDKIVNWIGQQSAEKPFFVYFTPVAVHNPITPSKATAGKSKGGPFCDFISDLDLSVGRVLDVLEQKGFAKDTLVIFTSDNGGVNKPENANLVQTDAQKAGLKPVGPFRGGKHDVWEGGFRVPYLVRWPGHVPAGTVCDETISIVDTLASVAKITGYDLPKVSEGAEDSHDISKAWLGEKYEGSLRPDVIVHSADGVFAIRKAGQKWIEGVPADDVKPAAKKAHASQHQRMLYDLKNDLAEEKEISAAHPEVVKELEALLNRYRDGGYSRELPPAGLKPKAEFEPLPPLKNAEAVDLKTFKSSQGKEAWTARDDAMFGRAGAKGSALTGPFTIQDGVLEFEIRLGEADRHSLRIHTADNAHSFRVVLSKAFIDIAKNPGKGESSDQTVPLGKSRVKFKSGEWQTLRLTFQGDELTAQFAGTTTKSKHAVFAETKTQLNFIAFDGEVGVRKVITGNRP